jgi:4-diphosphocytidyl-2-C-methyl-D-erythritol kinase
LNELFGQALPVNQLSQLAARLGSDVPFFLQSHPALSTGRGELIAPLAVFPRLEGRTLALLHPGFGSSTPWAYKTLASFPEHLNGRSGRARELVRALESEDGTVPWGGLLYNSLEAPAFWKYPVLKLYVEAFKELGSVGALMSGSGSTVFGWFEQRAQAERAIEVCRGQFGHAFWSAILP